MHPLADRFLARPKLLRHELVDNYHGRFSENIVIIEKSPAAQGNFHRLKISSAGDPRVRVYEFLSRQLRPALNRDGSPSEGLAEGKRGDASGSGDARNFIQRTPELAIRIQSGLSIAVSAAIQSQLESQHIMRIEPHRHVLQPRKTPNHQPSPNQKHDG